MIRLCQSWCQKYQGVFTIYVYSANIFFVAKIQITYDNTIAYEKRKVLSSNGSLKFEITAKRLYAASQRVL